LALWDTRNAKHFSLIVTVSSNRLHEVLFLFCQLCHDIDPVKRETAAKCLAGLMSSAEMKAIVRDMASDKSYRNTAKFLQAFQYV